MILGLVAALACAAPAAHAQPASESAWSLRASAATYFVPDEEDYVQPTIAADRGALHLETRYNYEDHESMSGFAGWNVEFGEAVKLAVTPMFGVVGGRTDGVIPALEVDLAWRRLELYAEGEYVIPFDERINRFLYNWSEASVWPVEWLRAGVVTQRTRTLKFLRSDKDIQRGLLAGVRWERLEGAFYLFNPGSDDQFFVASIGVTFGGE